jgi:hypothetical protein
VKRPWLLLAVVLLLSIGACVAAARVAHVKKHPGTAAVAIRDHVPGYQKFFTAQYTQPRLEAGYERAWYFTATPSETRHEDFVAALDEATRHFPNVDVFLLAHGNRYVDWVAELPAAQRARIRLVYDTGGGSAYNGPRWRDLGVHAFVGHPGGNIAPVFYLYFLPAWLSDVPLASAVDDANLKTKAWLDGPFGKVLGRFVDVPRLWAGTEAQVF